MNRDEMLRRLDADRAWDVVVIGGGATGLGVAVDARTRGYRTLLVEQADFASATSSRSTKLVHGGVRYLEQGDIALVMEALHERGLMHANAPHVARNLPFVVPRYRWWEGPFYGIGLKAYDLLAGRLNLVPSRILDRDETIARIPNVEPADLLGGVMYYDGQFDDARMAVTLAQTAADHGACLLNYTRVTGLVQPRRRPLRRRAVRPRVGRHPFHRGARRRQRDRDLRRRHPPARRRGGPGGRATLAGRSPRLRPPVPGRRGGDHGAPHRRRPRPLRHPVARPGPRRNDRHGDAGAGDGAAAPARRDRLHPPQRGAIPRDGPGALGRPLRFRRSASARPRSRQGDPGALAQPRGAHLEDGPRHDRRRQVDDLPPHGAGHDGPRDRSRRAPAAAVRDRGPAPARLEAVGPGDSGRSARRCTARTPRRSRT